jgi:hypothetical protein
VVALHRSLVARGALPAQPVPRSLDALQALLGAESQLETSLGSAA